MSFKFAKNILIYFTIFIIGALGFYKFMTYDRAYTWSKEYKIDIQNIAKQYELSINSTQKINTDQIKLPTERAIKINIQKFLAKIDLMSYPNEYGEFTRFSNSDTKEIINCKAWCLGDHLIGLEFEYQNISPGKLSCIKDNIESLFSNYKIIWTDLDN